MDFLTLITSIKGTGYSFCSLLVENSLNISLTYYHVSIAHDNDINHLLVEL